MENRRTTFLFAGIAVGLMAVAMPASAADNGVPLPREILQMPVQDYGWEERERARTDAAEIRKRDLRARAGYRDPGTRGDACPRPYKMTERDGCQLR